MKSEKVVRRVLTQAALAILTLGVAPLCSAFYLCFTDMYPYSDVACRSAPTVYAYEYVNDNTRRRVLVKRR